MPRYFIHTRLGERQLGIYSAMAYATVAMILVADSLGHCAIPRLSRLYTAGRMADFRSLLLRLVAAGGGVGLAGLAVAHVMGVRLLTLHLWPGVCRSLSNFPGVDLGHGNSLCGSCSPAQSRRRAVSGYRYRCMRWSWDRTHWRAPGGCQPRDWPAAQRQWRWQRWCIGAGRRSSGPVALVPGARAACQQAAATLRCRLGSEYMICLSVLQRRAGYAIVTCQPIISRCRCSCQAQLKYRLVRPRSSPC